LYVDALADLACEDDMLTCLQQPWWIRPWPWRCSSFLSDGRTLTTNLGWKRSEMDVSYPVLGRSSEWHTIA
jgi:hypothetical protein